MKRAVILSLMLCSMAQGANEIRSFTNCSAAFAVVREIDGDVWYVSGQVFEAWGTSGRTATHYNIALTAESGGMFTGTFDTNISAGYYYVVTHDDADSTPADTDPAVWQDYGYWDGSSVWTSGVLVDLTGIALTTDVTTAHTTTDAKIDTTDGLIGSLNNVSTANLATALTNYDGPTDTEMLAAHSTTDGLISGLVVPDAAGVVASAITSAHTTTDGLITSSHVTTDALLTTIDGVVDDILADTSAYDTDAEHATAIWNALTNAYGGVGTYGQLLEDMNDVNDVGIAVAVWTALVADYTSELTFGGELGGLDPNITLILEDTGTTIPATLALIKYKTDLISLVDTVVKDSNDANNFTIEDGTDVNDAYWFMAIQVEDADDNLSKEIRWISFYDENSGDPNLWVDEPFSFTPAVNDVVHIMGTTYGGYLYQIMRNLAQTRGVLNVIDQSKSGTGGLDRAGAIRIDALGDDP